MTTSTNEVIEFWASAIREQASSGLTVTEYCQRIGRSTSQFYYWKRRVGNDAPKTYDIRERETRGFIELRDPDSDRYNRDAHSDYVDIQVGSFSIRFTEHTDRALFKAAASVLLEVAR